MVKKYFIILFLLIIFSLSLYFIKFHNGLSENSNDWGNFGDYIGGVCSVIVAIFAILFSVKVSDICNSINIAISKDEQENNKREKCIDRITSSYEDIAKLFSQYNMNNENNNQISLLIKSKCRIIDYYAKILPQQTTTEKSITELRNKTHGLYTNPISGKSLEELSEAYTDFMRNLFILKSDS